MIVTALAMIGSALIALVIVWPFMWIIYGLVIGGFLIKLADNL